jgi:pyruvate dehydrogenase E2 component (dihydrolipoamide acetyltransferase)
MITEIRAPKTGLTAETLHILTWHKKEGEFVEEEELLLTVETEKTTLDIISPRSGFLKQINFQANEAVTVSEVIGYLADSMNESLDKPKRGKLLVSPIARKIAAEHQVPLSEIQGSGPNGRIQKSDIEKYLRLQAGAREVFSKKMDHGKTGIHVRSDSIRRATAEVTSRSKTTIPHYYLFSSFDVTDLLEKRQKPGSELKPSIVTILIKACSTVIEKHPALNRRWTGDTVAQRTDNRIGFVVKTEGGIIIPHIDSAYTMPMPELERKVRTLIQQAKELEIPAETLQAGTISISNLGMYPIDCFVPIIYPCESGMMGIGQIRKDAVWNGNDFTPRDIMPVTMALDHRLIDGAEGAEFIQGLKNVLESTNELDVLEADSGNAKSAR